MSSGQSSLSADSELTEYQTVMDRHMLASQAQPKANDAYKTRLMELIGLASFLSGSTAVASRPMMDKHVGGASLLGVGLIAADLHHHLFGGKVVEASQSLFGGAAEGMRTMGVVACSVLSGGTFYRMVKDGGVKNPMDPRWLSVAATAAYFMAGHAMMEPNIKRWVESRFGDTLTLATDADGKKSLEVPTTPFFKQLAFAMGGAHILAYGLIRNENISKFIGGAFMVGPTMSLGNLLWKGAQDSHESRANPDTRIHFLSSSHPGEDAAAYQQSLRKPLVDDEGRFHFDEWVRLIGMAKNPGLIF